MLLDFEKEFDRLSTEENEMKAPKEPIPPTNEVLIADVDDEGQIFFNRKERDSDAECI